MSGRDDALLEEIRERFTYGTDEWADIRKEAQKDMRYLTGDCWDEKERKEREDAGRPVLSLDELSQYVNQAVNRERQHKRGLVVTAQGSGANDQTARLRQGLYRQIEYRSNAQTDAYITMFENAVQRSYGFLAINARYVSERSFDQELVVEPFPNPDVVTMDPNAIKVDGSDMGWAFVHESRSEAEFRREWPSAQQRDFAAGGRIAPGWFSDNKGARRVQVAAYWRVTKVPRQLVKLKPGAPSAQDPDPQPIDVFVDELEAAVQQGQIAMPGPDLILAQRLVDYPRVEKYFTNGVEVLRAPGHDTGVIHWPGKRIPIVPCFGKVVWVQEGGRAVRKILSLIRLARDPQMLYCFYRTNQCELVGMTPKTPFIAYEGQLDSYEDDWAEVNVKPKAYLLVKPVVEGVGMQQQVLPLPQRQPYDPPIQVLEVGAEGARRAIQAALGISPLPSSAQRRNDKSGVALEQIDSSEQIGSFHFADHYNASLQGVGAIFEDVAPHFYDTARDVTIRKPDDTPTKMRINDPKAQEPVDLSADHLHDVTISTGPSMESERRAAEEFATVLANSPAFQLIGDLVVKLRNLGPIGDEIAERLTPPQFKKQPNLQNLPPDAQRALAQANGKIQELGGQLQQLTEQLKTDAAKQQAMREKTKSDFELALRLQVMRNAAAIAVAKINALTKGVVAAAEGRDEAIAEALQQLHDAEQAELDRGHEQQMALLDQAHALQKGEADTANAASLAAQGHQQNLEAAAAAPAPPMGGA